MLRQHLAREQVEVHEHVAVFNVVYKQTGGQAEFGELTRAVVRNP